MAHIIYIRAQARARKHLVIGVVTCKMGHGFGVILGQLALVELVYSVACGGKRLLIEGKARGAWCCVSVCGGERWFALIGRRHVVASLLAGESVVGVYFYSCVLHTRKRKH